jgi:hypothetical protein
MAGFALSQTNCNKKPQKPPWNTNCRGRSSTVDLLIKVAWFVTKANIFFNLKIKNLLVQGV